MYGKELILDIHDAHLPTSRDRLELFFRNLCELIGMEREDLHFWDYEGDPKGYENAPSHLKGISGVQFISTSSIVIHNIDEQKKVFLNIFSCKDFDPRVVVEFCVRWFEGNLVAQHLINRL